MQFFSSPSYRKFIFARIIFAAAVCFAMGCASKPTGYHGVDEVDEDSRQHPSSYFIDRFNVEKEMPKSKGSNVPFFFKKCDEAGAGYPSRTSYDCDYPM